MNHPLWMDLPLVYTHAGKSIDAHTPYVAGSNPLGHDRDKPNI